MFRFTGAALAALLITACQSWVPANRPIDHVEGGEAFKSGSGQNRDAGRAWIFVAFSGGGSRAAAFAYGVLEELRDTEIGAGDAKMRLLDEVDTLSGVSGGSFPAAYYGLYQDRIFEDFEERFLYRNITGALFARALIPWNLIGILTPLMTRSDLASHYYDKHLFDGARFEDLAAATGPTVHINATDLVTGVRFTFNEGNFEVICSDFAAFPISTAVAASSAVPGLLSAITLRNYAGRCGFEPPSWWKEALETRRTNPRRYRTAKDAMPYLDSDTMRYIYLVDGAVSDNLGMRVPLERLSAMGGIEEMRKLEGLEVPDHLVVIVVNAENEPDPRINLKAAAPSLAASMGLVTSAQIRRYNFETLQLTHDSVEQWARSLSKSGKPVTGHVVEVSFDLLEDEKEQKYFKRLPTSFNLSDDTVDRLREVGGRLLRESPEFQVVLQKLRQ